MKELSIEEKAKRYDKAIERANSLLSSNELGNAWIYKLLPELKESKNEKIRKAIGYAIGQSTHSDGTLINGVSSEEALAWLEKQGEQKATIIIPKFKVGDEIKTANEESLTITKIDGKGYWSEDLFICGFDDAAKWELVEQKPADLKTKAGNWYICDMEVMNENMVTAFHRDEIYYCPKDGYIDVGGTLFKVGCLDVFRLATENEIPQPKHKPAWSEEDEKMIGNIRRIIEQYAFSKSAVDVNGELCEKEYIDADNFLKSLKERYTWKPSDEQMLAINTAINVLGKGTINGKYLVELHEQLLKLREK